MENPLMGSGGGGPGGSMSIDDPKTAVDFFKYGPNLATFC